MEVIAMIKGALALTVGILIGMLSEGGYYNRWIISAIALLILAIIATL